jgi:hypothetical protein
MSLDKLTIVVSGMISAVPYQGGATWAVLQYLLGFKELGHEVYFVESLKQTALAPAGALLEASVNAAYFRQIAAEFGFERNSILTLEGTDQSVGLNYDSFRRAARRADLLVNISGTLTDESLMADIPVRVYLDLDPGFTQLWQSIENIDLHVLSHTHFVTIGLAIGQPGCRIPTCGVQWIPTLQPVALRYWPAAEGFSRDALTTVANWRGYGSIQHGGLLYGQKAHSLRQFITLPSIAREKFMLALAIHPDERNDLAALEENGWILIDPVQAASTPALYQEFVRGSKAEFGIAKSGYVLGECGWFSDRSICYLASGRPVIAQETGFSEFLPTGEGLFNFKTHEDVLAGIEELRSDYSRHSRAARLIAEQHFESGKVLSTLLDCLGVPA